MLIDVVPTHLTPAAAELTLVTVPDDMTQQDLELSGQVVGPSCAYAETIEVAYAVKPLPRDSDFLRAHVVIPEPTFWSPQTPFLYSARLEIRQRAQELDKTSAAIGLKDLRLHAKKGMRLNGERIQFDGYFGRSVTEEEARALHESGVNLLVVPLKKSNLPLWSLANRLGFFLLGVFDPEDDEMLWHASDILNREPCTFGWLFPQEMIGMPQHWHNAASLLHSQRPDVFIGIKVDQLPLGALPGHVAFAVGEYQVLEQLSAQGLPGLGLLPRGNQATVPELASAWLGWVRRTLSIAEGHSGKQTR